MEKFQFYQSMRNHKIDINLSNLAEIDLQVVLSVTFHSMFSFIRSNDLKQSFSEIVLKTIIEKSKNNEKNKLQNIEMILNWAKNPKTPQDKYLSQLFTKIPSKEYIDLIWNLREFVIQIFKKESHYFKSLEGIFVPTSEIPKILKAFSEIKEIKSNEFEREIKNHTISENQNEMVDVNVVIFCLTKLFALYNCYALKEPGVYVPSNRSVKACVYLSFKKEENKNGR